MTFKPALRRRARRLALQALYQWQLAGADITTIEAEFLVDNDTAKFDVSYFSEILRNIPKSFPDLDSCFVNYLDRDITALDAIELVILRIATYEFSQRLEIPYKVIINEALELGKIFGATDSYKYLNGVLDRVARNIRTLEINS